MASLGYFKKGSKLIPNTEDNSGGGGSSSSVLRVTYTVDWDNEQVTGSDKTFNEIMSAYNNGAYIYAEADGDIFQLKTANEDKVSFIELGFLTSADNTIMKMSETTITHGYDSEEGDYFSFVSASKSF